MAKIERYNGNIAAFASQADTNRRTTFGTEITGDDTLDGNITADYLTGWQIVGPNEFPTLEDFNAAFFTIGRLMAYVHQVGMPEWNGQQEFHSGSMTNRNGVIYVCRTDNHISVTPPESDSANWRLPRAGDIGYDNTDSGLAADELQAAIDELQESIVEFSGVDGFSVGSYQTIQTNLTGAQEPDQTRWIKLTAGEDGAGQYNEGKLINETITGSGDTVVITAEISDPDSPMNGQVINLINSENRYVSPGESAGTVANDQMQRITGEAARIAKRGGAIATGAFTYTDEVNWFSDAASERSATLNFDSAGSPNARTGTKTDVKHIQATAYIKFKE